MLLKSQSEKKNKIKRIQKVSAPRIDVNEYEEIFCILKLCDSLYNLNDMIMTKKVFKGKNIFYIEVFSSVHD